ncbi:cob(I)yrinic acid a,c-diamide adenosyltransferase [Hyphococcus flavus]|uniref:Corrinoid adenosyltransferase n=1 Tax=Hyphococcus flavus TaxID=1866326 RepID=A0AAF0CGJ1_9PROT|nr:cob(I)yrinic acid a,c-diamide adenosyltransferase [Hyphococcus flavus]WDI32429.1 cob(I)yrinic acid a,c-diamide adenosyltransferase [Hyphococcus flavus]
MSNRLTKIVTRGGDKGQTSLGDGARVEKNDPRIGLLGDVDELNSSIGVVASHLKTGSLAIILRGIQHDLFDLGGALSFPGTKVLSEKHVARLDEIADELNAGLPPLKEFILPGGSPALSFCHVARTVCRRVERAMAAFHNDVPDAEYALQYLNRLSDVLFIIARVEAKQSGVAEIYWRKENSLASQTE